MMILLVAAAFSLLLGRINYGPLFFLVAFPGVVLHELAHYVVALVLGAQPNPINLIPRKDPDGGWTLGSVEFCPSWWNAGFVALAPLYVLPAVGWAIYWSLDPASLQNIVVGGYVLGCIGWGFKPSGTDWRVALRWPLGTFALLGGIALVVHAAYLEVLARWGTTL